MHSKIYNIFTLFEHRKKADNVSRSQGFCNGMCNQNDIEDEFHFILKFPFYEELKKEYILLIYYAKSNVYRLHVVKLLSVHNTRELNNPVTSCQIKFIIVVLVSCCQNALVKYFLKHTISLCYSLHILLSVYSLIVFL